MNKPSFYLKKPKAQKDGIVYMDLSYNGLRLQASTGLKLNEKEWSKDKGYLKANTTFYKHYNDRLERASKLAQEYYSQSMATGTVPHPTVFRAYLKKKFTNKDQVVAANPESDFLTRSAEYVEYNSVKLKAGSIAIYKQAIDELHAFTKAKGIPLTFENINLSLWDKYHAYLLTKENKNANCKTEFGYLNDTIAKRASNIKTFMKWAFDRNYHKSTEYQKITAKRSSKNEIVTLTKAEVNTLLNLDLSEKKRLERVRDLFLFGIFTCQRWSDIENFNVTDFKNNTWTFKAIKTQKITEIPMETGFTSVALAILKKYGYILPKITGQTFNRYLKEVGELAGISEEIVIHRSQGRKSIEFRKPKYAYMASHMARRTGITLLLEGGVPATTIMKISGHSSLSTLMKYENTSNEALVNALKMVNI